VPHVPAWHRAGPGASCHVPGVCERRRSDAHALDAAARDAFAERVAVTDGEPLGLTFCESFCLTFRTSFRLAFGKSVRFACAVVIGLTQPVGVAQRVVQPNSVTFADAVRIGHAFAGGA
jgi:hypothetical protein